MEFNANFSFYVWMLLEFWKTAAYFVFCTMCRKTFLKKQMLCVKKTKLKVFLTKRLRESARNNLVPVKSAFMGLTPASYTVLFYLEEVC